MSARRDRQDAVVSVASWRPDEDFYVYPVGKREKRAIFCPDDPPHSFLVPRHRYMFKIPEGWRAPQIWSEVVAYELGLLCGVPVPPYFVAEDRDSGQTGVLSEFFYGHRDQPWPKRFVSGADLMQAAKYDYDEAKRNFHNLRTNLAICKDRGLPDPIEFWGRLITFDALIGNTDRHPENWGIVYEYADPHVEVSFAPAFDNGTSLGYEVPERKLRSQAEPEALDRYIGAGRHHVRFAMINPRRGHHIGLCAVYARHYPAAVPGMRGVLSFDWRAFEDMVAWCATLQAAVPFTEERAAFVTKLVEARRGELLDVLGD